MSNFVTFECTHIADADQNNPDEYMAIAYADIDGFPADENREKVCRVWMLKEKRGIYPTYLVNWYENDCRTNESVIELINQTKNDLKAYRSQMEENLFKKAYSRYKLQWLVQDGYTTELLMEKIQHELDNGADNLQEAFDFLEQNLWTDGGGWESDATFREQQWKDKDYMKNLLTKEEFSIWYSF